MFKLEIKTENAAFGLDPRWEVARMLEALAHYMNVTDCNNGKLRDSNGNTIGQWGFE